jgi:hypothetical protein
MEITHYQLVWAQADVIGPLSDNAGPLSVKMGWRTHNRIQRLHAEEFGLFKGHHKRRCRFFD